MSEFKVGDVVDVAFKAVVVNHTESTLRIRHHSGGRDSVAIWRDEATKPKPALPTAFGSIVKVDGAKWVRLADEWAISTFDYQQRTDEWMRQYDFEVIRDGV